MTRQHCTDHIKVCESLARIEGKLDTVIQSNEKQWGRLEKLQSRSDYRNGMDKGRANSTALIASGVSLFLSLLTLGLRAFWAWRSRP